MGGRDIEICWWCQARKATTREHRVKRSRLEDEIGLTQIPQPLVLYSSDPAHPYPAALRSSDSSAAKFGKTMCATCNGVRSQLFDNAYKHFADWSFSHPDYIREEEAIVWGEVFRGKEFDQRHLSRYYLKNICCRLVDGGLKIPPSFIDHLDDLAAEECFSLVAFKDLELADEFKKVEKSDYFSPYIQTALAEDERDSTKPIAYYAAFVDGYVGVLFGWVDELYRAGEFENLGSQQEARLYGRKGLPQQQLFAKLDLFTVVLKNRRLASSTPSSHLR